MKLRNLKHNRTASFIVSVVVLITLMIGIIIGSIIFFAFSDASQANQTYTKTFTIPDVNATTYINLTFTPDGTTPALVMIGNGGGVAVPAANYSRSGKAVVIDTTYWTWDGNTTFTAAYNKLGYTQIDNVVLYAITIFALLAIVPLIVVGGLMLKSLGFMTGGETV